MGLKVTVEKRGRVVIPSEVRRLLKIEEGSELELFIEGGKIVLKPSIKLSAKDLYGVAGEEKVNVEELESSLGEE